MKLPDAEKVDPAVIASLLRTWADVMIRHDGDRDHMSPSSLRCGQTQSAFKLMMLAANKLDLVKSDT